MNTRAIIRALPLRITAFGIQTAAAEDTGFDLLLTTDKNIRYQQNLKGRRLAIIVLSNSQRPSVEKHMDRVVAAVAAAVAGSYAEVKIPHEV
jgi:hypothetical protein